MKRSPRSRAVVIGGGIIGLSLARELAADGWAVTVLERSEPGREASRAAAGMLAPRLEFHGRPDLLAVGLHARELYPEFAAGIEAETGRSVDLRLDGIVAPFPEEAAAAAVPEGAELLDARRLHDLEPSLAASSTAALFFRDDGSVDNRALVEALLEACRLRGVEVRTGRRAERVLVANGRAAAVRCGVEEFEADVVANCAGAWAGQIEVPGASLDIRPIKGQMLLLHRGEAAGAGPQRTVSSELVYLVPRSDGRVIVGTTVEDRGFDKEVEAGPIQELLERAIRLCPGLAAARFVEAWAGLRPRGKAELPVVGPSGPSGYFVAAGHYRNGILLAPLTARALADIIAGRVSRFTEVFPRPA